jgi:hypothetical protein
MGCPHSFEFRRQELLEMGVISSDDSDESQGQKIVDSYLGIILSSNFRFCSCCSNLFLINVSRCTAARWVTGRIFAARNIGPLVGGLFVCSWRISSTHSRVLTVCVIG